MSNATKFEFYVRAIFIRDNVFKNQPSKICVGKPLSLQMF